jgi:hypothetical protein
MAKMTDSNINSARPNNIRINPLKYPNVKCECGNEVWLQGVVLKQISGLELGTGTKDQLIDIPVFYCSKCGEVFPEDKKIYKIGETTQEQPEKPNTLIL